MLMTFICVMLILLPSHATKLLLQGHSKGSCSWRYMVGENNIVFCFAGYSGREPSGAGDEQMAITSPYQHKLEKYFFPTLGRGMEATSSTVWSSVCDNLDNLAFANYSWH